jgi:DNA-binding MarR family transcriptional regulator
MKPLGAFGLRTDHLDDEPGEAGNARWFAGHLCESSDVYLGLCAELDAAEITHLQFFFLRYVVQNTRVTMRQIIDLMGRSGAAASGLVKRLESLGYLRRFRDAKDTRMVFVRVTRPGEALLERMEERLAALVQRKYELAPD